MIRSLIGGFSGFSGSTPTSWVIRSFGKSSNIRTLCYGGGKFVLAPRSNTNIYTSTDGITWVISATDITWTAYSSVYSTSTFVLVGYTQGGVPSINTSTDGITWTSRSATGFGSTAYIKDICWSGTYLVAVSDEGHIATSSSTGSSWTQRAKCAYALSCVTYGGGVYVALGNNELFTSTNGTTWTDRTGTNPNISANSVAYGASKFVVVGNKIFTSPDGITWTQRTSPFGTTNIKKVTYGNGKFVAVGDLGKIATSTDGISWLLSESPVTTTLYDVDYGASNFIAVGDSGVVITSPTGL